MIRITYAAGDEALAERIRDDLAGGEATAPLLIVLVSAESNADPLLREAIDAALRTNTSILPILTDAAPLPSSLAFAKPLDFRRGYQRERLLRRVNQLTMSRTDIKRANRRALILVGGIALLMFAIAIAGIIAGQVAFPVAEYNEEATFQAQWIDGLIRETLEAAQPHTTQDAVGFSATLEAAPTRLYYYIRGTATAMGRAGGS